MHVGTEKGLTVNEPNNILDSLRLHGKKDSENTKNPDLKTLLITSETDNFNSSSLSTVGVVPINENLLFETENPSEDITPERKKFKAKEAYQVINGTKTVIAVVGGIAKLSNNDSLNDLLESSDGALSASKGLVELKDNIHNQSENKTKTVMSSISQVANGVGGVLNAVNIPEAEILTLTGRVVGLGADGQNLSENIDKKNPRGIIGTSVSIARGAWGTIVSGVGVTKIGANLGAKFGLVSTQTVAKISSSADKVNKFADKVAIPFAVASTGLTLWDWQKSNGKINDKEKELVKLIQENKNVKINPKVLKRNTFEKRENYLKNEVKILKTNSKILGISFGISAVSTTALIASVAFPITAPIAGPIALGGSVAGSVVNTLADDKTRKSIKETYHLALNKYNNLLGKAEKLIFSSRLSHQKA